MHTSARTQTLFTHSWSHVHTQMRCTCTLIDSQTIQSHTGVHTRIMSLKHTDTVTVHMHILMVTGTPSPSRPWEPPQSAVCTSHTAPHRHELATTDPCSAHPLASTPFGALPCRRQPRGTQKPTPGTPRKFETRTEYPNLTQVSIFGAQCPGTTGKWGLGGGKKSI